MGLFDTVTAPAWQGSTKAGTTSRYNLADLWNPYVPQLQQSTWDPNAPTKYSGAEGDVIKMLSDIIKYGGYSPEQKARMFQSGATPVYDTANTQSRQAQADAYSRGLGQSGVLSRSYGDIDKNTQNALSQLTSSIEQQSAAQVLPAAQMVQTGQKNFMEMMQNQSQFNTQMAQEREKLATQLNISAGELSVAIARINSTAEMSDADRALELQKLMNQYGLDAAQMEMLQAEAKKDRWASFWANLFGGAADVGLGALGIK